uniref:Uncharacterized protein n=1 Tax=Strongyloides papillosus TaxID=174720 RepID=A0A0N5BBT4_STREA
MIFFNRIKQYIPFIFCILIIEFVKLSLSSESDKLPGDSRKQSSRRKSQSPPRLRIKGKDSNKGGLSPAQRRRVDTLRKQLNVGQYEPKSRPVSEIRLPERKSKVGKTQRNINTLERKPSLNKSNQKINGQRRHSITNIGQPSLQKTKRRQSQQFKRSKSCRGYFCFG